MQLFGQVTDAATGESLPNATIGIYIQPNCITTPCNGILVDGMTTDPEGWYSTEVPSGHYAEASFVGYVPQRINATSGSGDVALVRATNQKDEAVVTANRTWPLWAKLLLVFSGFGLLALIAYMYFKED